MNTQDPQKIELAMLLEPVAGPCVSLYAPMERAGQSEQNPLRVQNLMRQAAAVLAERGHSQDENRQWLKPLEEMLPDRHYWEHQKLGFAAFLSPQCASANISTSSLCCPCSVKLIDSICSP